MALPVPEGRKVEMPVESPRCPMSSETPTTNGPGRGPDLCGCSQKRLDSIRDEIVRRRLRTVEEVYEALLDGGGCRTCTPDIARILQEIWGEPGGITRRPES